MLQWHPMRSGYHQSPTDYRNWRVEVTETSDHDGVCAPHQDQAVRLRTTTGLPASRDAIKAARRFLAGRRLSSTLALGDNRLETSVE